MFPNTQHYNIDGRQHMIKVGSWSFNFQEVKYLPSLPRKVTKLVSRDLPLILYAMIKFIQKFKPQLALRHKWPKNQVKSRHMWSDPQTTVNWTLSSRMPKLSISALFLFLWRDFWLVRPNSNKQLGHNYNIPLLFLG